MAKPTIQHLWAHKKIADSAFLSSVDKMKNIRRKKNILLLTGSHLTHYVDYKRLMDKGYDTISVNFGYLLPHAENFTYHFHGSIGYINKLANCKTFKLFCDHFKGCHIFMVTTAKCSSPMYAIPTAASVRKCIINNNIKRYLIITHAMGHEIGQHGYSHIPDLTRYSPSSVPYGYGGTVSAMVVPFLLQLGYATIAVAGVGIWDNRHFYDDSYVNPTLYKPFAGNNKNIIIARWKGLRAMGEKNGTKIVAIPHSRLEKETRKTLITLPQERL